ncbi:mitochondrial Rho GTPase 1 [Olea europaea subsp. europaea]|uniref:Mitochondrial Rho GTPase 1 n=1 Tax=Olea europaea subsp. europaea TaxID=158383 RepID=A0A8S0VDF6_OLEEU|nr:mitochondrial Rho GTPase 1 [Olea europaea subsp. europaea]
MKERDLNNVFSKIVNAAEKPHLSFPETDAGRTRKRYCQLVNHSLIFVSGQIACYYSLQRKIAVAAANAFVGIAAYRAYVTRKNSAS